MTPVIYLASPIDQGTISGMKDQALQALLTSRCAVFDPGAGWSVPAQATPSEMLQHGNMALLNRCDGLLAILDPKILTIGVVMEILHARANDMPAHVWAPNLRTSWSLASLHVPVYRYLDDAIRELIADVRV